MRRVFSLLLLLSLLLAACGPGNTDEDGPIPGLDATPTPGPSTGEATAVPAGGVTISFAAWENEIPVYERMAAKFTEENPGITVTIVPMDDLMNSTDPNAAYDPVSQVRRIVSGADTAPSFVVSPEVFDAGLLLDMKPLMDGDSAFNPDDFYPGALARSTYPNGMFVMPRYIYMQILSYNKDLFASADLPAPSPDWTWSDLFAAAEQIASADSKAYGFFDYSSGFSGLLAEIEARDLKLLQTPPADVDLTAPEMVATLERVKELIDNRAIFNAAYKEGQEDPQQTVRDGRVAIFPGELFTNGPIADGDGGAVSFEGEELPFEVGSIPYPVTKGPFGFNSANVDGFIISSGTQHANEAWKWIEWLSRQPLDATQGGGYAPGRTPARISLAESMGYWDQLDPATKAAYQAALAQPVTPQTSTPDYAVFGPLSTAMYDVISNGTKPEAALKTAQEQLKEQLAQMTELTPTPKPDTAPVVVATPAPQVAPEGAALVKFDATGSNTSQLRRLARQFNEANPGFFVQVRATDTTTQPVTLDVIAKNNDCFSYWSSPQSEADFKSLLDLRPLFDGDASFKRDDFPPAVLGQFQSNGGIYGLPYSFNVRNLGYNKTMFDTAGVAAPVFSWQPADFLAAAKALTSGSGDTKQYGYVAYGGGPFSDMFFFVNQFGGQVTTGSGDSVRPNFADPKVVEAIQWYIDLAKVHGVMPAFTIPNSPDAQNEDKSYDLVQNGRVGMWLDYGYGSFEGPGPDGNPRTWEPALASLPIGGAGLQSGDLWARGFYISASSQQQQGCWEWLKFISNDVTGLNGELPARISVADSEEFKQVSNPSQLKLYEVYREALQKPSSVGLGINGLYSATPFGVDFYWVNKAINDTIEKDADLGEGLKNAQDLTIKHIDCVIKTKKPATCARELDPDYNGYNTQDPDPNQPINGAKG